VERGALAVVRETIVEIVVPVHNGERDLERSVRRLRAHLDAAFPFHATVTIADNASTDTTSEIGRRLARDIEGVRYMRLSDRGRGRAVAAAWLISRADVVAYLELGVRTPLEPLLPLVALVAGGHSDVASGARVRRNLASRAFDAVLALALGARFRDAHLGLKATRVHVARRLVPQVEDRNRFFDVELLVLARRSGLRVTEVPVDWTDCHGSRRLEDLTGVWRLVRSRGRRERLLEVMTADGA
jgi:glycosyltransferase involved in cell wall biosynthesis